MMKAKISMLMDGELEDHELEEAITALAREGEARDAWRAYHLIRDALRGDGALSADFARNVAARLVQEPAILAPRREQPKPARSRWIALSAAASVTAIALVGWLAFAPQPDVGGSHVAVPVAQAPQAQPKVGALVRVPLPSATNDYLLAHQGYSPRLTLQGVAPYVRTVSDEAAEGGTR